MDPGQCLGVLIYLWISWSAFRIVNLLVDPGQCLGVLIYLWIAWSAFRIVNLLVDLLVSV